MQFEGQLSLVTLTLIIWLHWLLLFVAEIENPIWFWIYPLLGILATAFWVFFQTNSPITRKGRKGILYWIIQIIQFCIVVFIMGSFFYSRFV